MRLIIGLGNPGKKYAHTRHNAGFRVVDALAREIGLKYESNKKINAEIAKGDDLLLVKPQTFMNNSGDTVRKLLTAYRLPLTSLLIVHDEIDLAFGKIKLSPQSGSAGHKGVESVISATGMTFPRLRIGVDNRAVRGEIPTDDYVLQNFTAEEEQELKEKIIPEALKKLAPFYLPRA